MADPELYPSPWALVPRSCVGLGEVGLTMSSSVAHGGEWSRVSRSSFCELCAEGGPCGVEGLDGAEGTSSGQ